MKKGRIVRSIALMLASGAVCSPIAFEGSDPPPDLLKKIASTASETAKARDNYTYRQSVTVDEFDHRDVIDGQYLEVRDITFSAKGERFEQVVSAPKSTLAQVKLTPEDFADIRNVQPFFLTNENARLYSAVFKGEESMDGYSCFVASIAPKQMLAGQRYFQGTLWVRQSDFAVVRSEGQAVPQVNTLQQQNLFPHFTTLWKEVDGKWMFPVQTLGDDTLFFRDWPQRIRITIRYANYKKFGAESTLTFEGEAPPPSTTPAPPPH